MPDTHSTPTVVQIVGLSYDKISHHISATADLGVGAVILAAAVLIGLAFRQFSRWRGPELTLDEAEFGIGDAKFKFKPNIVDRQVAYSTWIEVSTRKIGLAIDLDHDLVTEIYDSWYTFFKITRDLLKTIPADRAKDLVRRKSFVCQSTF